MFQNSFQNGNYFQLYDPKTSQEKIKNLFKITNVSPNNKVFDKDLKTYVLQFNSSLSKITFPKEQKKQLYLIQQYLVFQIYFYPGMSWSMELVISDLNKTKRRIMLSSTNNKLEIKPFFVKSPNLNSKEGVWNNYAIDLYSFMEAFKGQTYRCLDNVTIQGHFKLRRIYTTNQLPQQDNEQEQMKSISLLPKNFYFPPGVQHSYQLTKYLGENLSQINLYEPTEPSTKNNSSYLKSTKNRISTPKTETVKSEKIVQINSGLGSKTNQKQFLANTNGPQMLNRQRKRQKYHESSDSQSHIQNIKTPQSNQKQQVKSKKKLIKTQQMPPKAKSSVQKRQKFKIEQKQKIKSKLNPWRTNKRSQTSKLQINESDRDSSPNTTLFKDNKQRKSDHYSQSQYIELSQKFSTLTQGKFFSGWQVQTKVKQPDEIQQNIQMETNSIHSNRKESPQKQILQSICDSLDRRSPRKDFQQIGRQSYYGFAQRLVENYIQQRNRPFSPPMGQRQHTEEQQQWKKNQNILNQDKEVQLVYDPVLNCYYDHKTHTYYELKN